MFGIRRKLMLAFGGLVLIGVIIGGQSIRQFNELGRAIDVILRENYRSVIACQDMKEAIERMDSGTLFTLLGYGEEGAKLIRENQSRFDAALSAEQRNVTLPGEGELVDSITKAFEEYRTKLHRVADSSLDREERRTEYFGQLLPQFYAIKATADRILDMNQHNMDDANNTARAQAAAARRTMYAFLIGSLLFAAAFAALTNQWILKPLLHLKDSVNDVRQGHLDLVIKSTSRDEIGQLTQSFNEMAQALREARRSDLMELNRSRRATEEVFAHFPAAVAVLDRTGRVEVATPTARKYFNLSPKTAIGDVDVPWMKDLVDRAMREDREVTVNGASRMIQHFVDGKEFFFRPFALPIHDTTGNQTGTLLLFDDVTQLREQEEIKRGVISTVSHQLKTPLTSIRMGIHLLLAEKVGTLSEKQIELLIAARDDSDRLAKMVDDLLEISRIESGRAGVQLQAVPPDFLVMPVMDAFESQAKDQSVTLESRVRGDLDTVKADPSLVSHVFANLVGNALKFTSAGGTITVSAQQEPDGVKFTVADTGQGVPAENLPRVFDPFFRTPDPGGKTGAGLGLTIAKEIIQVHGGRIGVESQPGKGAQFWFTLPAAGPREPTRDIGGSLLIS